MELESLYLRKEKYGPNKGQMAGNIEFASDGGKITLVLTGENSREILRICADRLVAFRSRTSQRKRISSHSEKTNGREHTKTPRGTANRCWRAPAGG